MSLALNLMELDGKATPEAIADAIFRQNPDMPIPVPVEQIAQLAGVERLTPLETSGFEGMLVTNEHKTRAEIFYNGNAMRQRKRYTIGHELAHLLLPHHKQTEFKCTKEDMTLFDRQADSRINQEVEANYFSSELLMPRPYFKRRARELGEPELAHIQILHKECDTSIEATARRYVFLSDYACAVVYAKDRNVRYFTTSSELPYRLDIKPKLPLPKQSASYQGGAGLGDWEEIDAWVWLSEIKDRRFPDKILEQTLWQEHGHKVILLFLETVPDAEES